MCIHSPALIDDSNTFGSSTTACVKKSDVKTNFGYVGSIHLGGGPYRLAQFNVPKLEALGLTVTV